MGFLWTKRTRVLIQGITGNFDRSQTRLMQGHGTQIVAGVTPGKGDGEAEPCMAPRCRWSAFIRVVLG